MPFAPSSTVAIAAPPELVWELLSNTSTWPDWNDFTPKAELVSKCADFQEDKPTTMQVGCTYKYVVQRKAGGDKLKENLGGSVEIVTEIATPDSLSKVGNKAAPANPLDPPDALEDVWRVVWDQRNLSEYMLRTKRKNEIRRTADGCQFTTAITFEGPIAWLVKTVSAQMVTDGLQMCAEGLKREAEKKAAMR